MKYYTEDHAWIDVNEGEATIGITKYGIQELGKILSLKLPAEGEDYIVGDAFVRVNASYIYAPLSGTVSEFNEELSINPSLINKSPEDKGWLCRLKNIDSSELDDMMLVTAYAKYLKTLR